MKRKLIEVALPLEAINRESLWRKTKAPTGYPTQIHRWWAQRPVAACRAVVFASLVDDPGSHTDRFPSLEEQEHERDRLFTLIDRLVGWDATRDQDLIDQVRREIEYSNPEGLPTVADPFCGGGSIPLAAQWLGLESIGSDLNPVAVLVTRGLVDIPARFSGQPPVGPTNRSPLASTGSWLGARGLAQDVIAYADRLASLAWKKLEFAYPAAVVEGREFPVVAWLWARTVTCPNPACRAELPLIRSFALGTGKGRGARLLPQVEGSTGTVTFDVELTDAPPQPATVGRDGARCLACDQSVSLVYLREQATAGKMFPKLLAMVAEGGGRSGRVFLPASEQQAAAADVSTDSGLLDTLLPKQALGFRVQAYGMTRHRDLFTSRQLLALATLTDLVPVVRQEVEQDALQAGWSVDDRPLADGGSGAAAYADAIATYLSFAIARITGFGSTLSTWMPRDRAIRNTFGRQSLAMTWDFAEANPFQKSSGNLVSAARNVAECIEFTGIGPNGRAMQSDAVDALQKPSLVVTDPPYYDNIGYADLSDFFYVWHRRALSDIHPDLFGTVLTPKSEELIASPYRFEGDRAKAQQHFEDGLRAAFSAMKSAGAPGYPISVFYAFKQAEGGEEEGIASTGWEVMLEAMREAGLQIVGTWPLRTEGANRLVSVGTNALASSIVLVCRPRPDDAGITDRKAFLAELRSELPEALRLLQHGNIAPVDLAQASIGPGMAVFSKYAKVVEPSGEPMTVRTALGLINQVLGEVLTEQEDDFDADTRWAITWFEQHRYGEGKYGDAELLSKAKDTAVGGLEEAGIVESRAGKVRLLRSEELKPDWDPATDRRTPIWEVTQRLVFALNKGGGVEAAADIVRRTGGRAEVAKELAYRLYVTCERKNWADEARDFNSLVVDWPEITQLASDIGPGQTDLGLGG